MHRFLGIVIASSALVGCGGSSSPFEVTDIPEAHVTAPTESPDQEAMAESREVETPRTTSTPDQPAPTEVASASTDPVVDCTKLANDPAPSPRWLCEMSMAQTTDKMFAPSGFAIARRFESPADPPERKPSEEHLSKRVCSASEAKTRLASLGQTIRYTLSIPDLQPMITCSAMTCEIQGLGEWSTNITLRFRPGKDGPTLDSWGEIETAAVGDDEIAKRRDFIAKGLQRSSSLTCHG